MSLIELTVDGMTCGSCANTVHKALSRVPGVSEVAVDLTRGRASVTTADGGGQVTAIREALATVGYAGKPVLISLPVGNDVAERPAAGHCASGRTTARQGCCCGR